MPAVAMERSAMKRAAWAIRWLESILIRSRSNAVKNIGISSGLIPNSADSSYMMFMTQRHSGKLSIKSYVSRPWNIWKETVKFLLCLKRYLGLEAFSISVRREESEQPILVRPYRKQRMGA